jgi:hypothetical protein
VRRSSASLLYGRRCSTEVHTRNLPVLLKQLPTDPLTVPAVATLQDTGHARVVLTCNHVEGCNEGMPPMLLDAARFALKRSFHTQNPTRRYMRTAPTLFDDQNVEKHPQPRWRWPERVNLAAHCLYRLDRRMYAPRRAAPQSRAWPDRSSTDMPTVMASRLCQLMVALPGWATQSAASRPQHRAEHCRHERSSGVRRDAVVRSCARLEKRRGGCGVDVGKQAVYLGSGDVQRWWRVAQVVGCWTPLTWLRMLAAARRLYDAELMLCLLSQKMKCHATPPD